MNNLLFTFTPRLFSCSLGIDGANSNGMEIQQQLLKALIRRMMSQCEDPIPDMELILCQVWRELLEELETSLEEKTLH